MAGYIFGGNTGISSPEELANRRRIADALVGRVLGQQSAPRSVGEAISQGLGGIGEALVARGMERRADKAASAGQGSADAGIASLIADMGGGGAFPAAPAMPSASASPAAPTDVPSQRVAQAFAASAPTSPPQTATSGAPAANWLQYDNANAIRSQPLDPKLTSALGFLPDMGVSMKVFSGGQPSTGPDRTGSHRHDNGDAADVFFYKDGKQLDWNNPQDVPLFQQIVERAKANGVTGFGAGEGYMRPGSMHIGYGSPAVWGAGGRGTNAPDWLRQAYNTPSGTPPAVAATNAIAAPSPAAPPLPAPVNVPDMPIAGQPASPQPVQVAQAANTGTPGQMSDANALALLGASAVHPGQGASIADLLKTASNPWLNKNQSAIVGALLKQKLDPNAALDAEYKRAQIAHLTKAGGNVSYGQTPLMLTDPQDKMHMGQMSNGGGILIDGKVYGSLPDGWKVGTVSQSGSGGLSPQALDIISTQYLAGDKSAIQGFSRNATIRAQLANAIAEKADTMGMDGKAIAAEVSAYGGNVSAQRAAGTRAAQVGMAASEANQMADIAVEASQAVPRGSLMAWNAMRNAVRTGTSSPKMAAFVTATTSLVNAYARAISPLGAPTDAMRQHAEEMLNTAQSPQAYEAVIDQMKKEMVAALNAPTEISDRLKKQVTGTDHETASPATMPGSPPAPGQSAAPQPGQVEDGYRFKGGNPSDPNSWEPVQ